MGWFRKKDKEKDEPGRLVEELERDIQLGQKLAQQQIAAAHVDMDMVHQVQTAAMDAGAGASMQILASRMARLYAVGVETPAVILSVQTGQNALAPGSVWATLELTVQPVGGAPYEVSTEQALVPAVAQGLAPGQQVTVKVDPNDRRAVMLWGAGGVAPAGRALDDPAVRLAKLQGLRTSGVLTEDEFRAQKAKLEGP
jgi:putative oligomerization/nucleic acid binding protein